MKLTRQVKKKANDIIQNNIFEDEAINPKQEPNNNKTKYFFTKITETGLIGTDLPGKLPFTSKRGYKYIYVLYNYDANSILVCPMKNRTEEEFLRVHNDLIEYLKKRGLHPKVQQLNNEISNQYKEQIEKHNIQPQLTPAQIHRQNIAEKNDNEMKREWDASTPIEEFLFLH